METLRQPEGNIHTPVSRGQEFIDRKMQESTEHLARQLAFLADERNTSLLMLALTRRAEVEE